MDLQDLALRTFWTAVAAVLGVVIQAATDLPVWWAPILVTVATAALVAVRQKAPPIDG